MNKILLTGGAGFVGSFVLEAIVEAFPDVETLILDRMTYAADFENISHILERGKRTLTVGNITNLPLCMRLTEGVDCIIHLAAESHVDNSFGNSLEFTLSNTLGTHTLLEAARQNSVPLFVHVSTDEVYGEILSGDSKETDNLQPSNPYSASKAAAEMIVGGYQQSYSLNVITVRANNIFGIRQFPEKIIPKFIMQLLCGKKITVHGNGSNSRKYLAAEDFAQALLLLIKKGQAGEIYNIGADYEFTNLLVAEMICANLDVPIASVLEFVSDRPFNDQRYSVDCSKIRNLGWSPEINFTKALPGVVEWYRNNFHRYKHLFQ